ncbi:hypothetical protein JCGZ_02512 [Jatropha curcas]|uniref:Uncharacterized protein n=2 Tax=Jatropha curcas TaxID=180498 RepID=A0A067JRQ7_JATCU|nr:hypothetical protein JCGZ_02512 [Jatropha curcas]
MEATKFLSSPLFLRQPIFRHRRSAAMAFNKKENGGSAVDENMILLRVRIREMKITEESDNPPSHWMEWEKQYYAYSNYYNDVYEAVGLLQNFLMNIRPSLAFGILAVVLISMFISTGVVLFQFTEITTRILIWALS